MLVRPGIENLIAQGFQPLLDLIGADSSGIKIYSDPIDTVADADRAHPRQCVQFPLDCLRILLIAGIS